MKMKELIEAAEKKAGKQVELARILGIRESYLRQAKLGKSGLPDAICIKPADYLETDRLEVIAASNLVTEKDEERRKVFESCFSGSKAASFTTTALFIGVILIMTPSSAHAGWATVSGDSMIEYFVLCKINYILPKWWQKIYQLLSILSFSSKRLPQYSHFAECPYIR